MFTIEVQDNGVQAALQAIAKRASNMQPILQAIGEDIMERTKERFATGTGPDGQRWQGNSMATIQALIAGARGKKGGVLKNGNLSKKAQTSLAGKKVLIDTGSLEKEFSPTNKGKTLTVTNNSVTVGSTMKYSAIHQFGGKAGKGKTVTIPARPFLPIKQNGELYPAERTKILDALNDYLAGK